MILLSNYDHQKTFALVRIFIILGITWVFGIIGIMGTSEDMLPLSFDDDNKDNIGEMGTRVCVIIWSTIMINDYQSIWIWSMVMINTEIMTPLNMKLIMETWDWTQTQRKRLSCATLSLTAFRSSSSPSEVILLTNMFITIIPPWTCLSMIFCRASFYFGSSLSTGHHLNSFNQHGTVK